jgi:hypothetical protein
MARPIVAAAAAIGPKASAAVAASAANANDEIAAPMRPNSIRPSSRTRLFTAVAWI